MVMWRSEWKPNTKSHQLEMFYVNCSSAIEDITFLTFHVTRDWRIIWVHVLKLLIVCHHPVKSVSHSHSGDRDAIFLICYVISQEHAS